MNDDFRDLLHALLRAGAQFLVVGAPFLSRHDLIRNKRASGRPKDVADLDILERGKG